MRKSATYYGMAFMLAFVMSLTSGLTAIASPGATTEVAIMQKDKDKIVYLVDGQEKTSKEVDKLDASEIEKMEFITDETEKKLYTDKDVETVVLITLKKDESKDEILD